MNRSHLQPVNYLDVLSASRDRSIVKLNFWGGGHGLSGLFSAIQDPDSINVLFDNSSELAKVAHDTARIANVFCLPIAEDETSASLIEKHYGANHPALKEIGNALSSEGNGQRGGLGAMGGTLLVQSRTFDDFASDLIDRILVQCRGGLKHIELRIFGSGAGGTNSLIQILMSEATTARLISLCVTIKVTFYMTDSVSFTQLGPHIHPNQAVALTKITDLITRPKSGAENRVVWNLRLIGATPVGKDSIGRQEIMFLDRQAWQCVEFERDRQVTDPNFASTSWYGNICHTSSDRFRSIPRALVAQTVASEYYAAIQDAIEKIHPVMATIDYIASTHSTVSLHRNTVEWIVENVDTLTVADMLQATMQPDVEHRYDFSVINTQGETFQCCLISEHFTKPPTTLVEASQNAKTVATILHALKNELVEIDATLLDLNRKVAKSKANAESSFKKLQSARYLISSSKRRAIRFATELRRWTDQQETHIAMKIELEIATRATTREFESQMSRLRQLSDILDRCRIKGRVKERRDLFYFNETNVAFSELLTLPGLDLERQILVLAAQACLVTAEGLQYILNTPVCTVEAFAKAAVGPASHPGAWPAAIPKHTADTIYVLPPTNAELNESLKDLILKMSPNTKVFTSASVKLGMNIIRFHVFHPQKELELLPGLLKAEYERVNQGPCRILHAFPSMNGKPISPAT